MLHRRPLVVFLLFVLELHSSAAQNTGRAARITGQVVEAASGTPVTNARVILESRSAGKPREVVTDDKGLFVLEAISSGSYLIHAERPGYITTNMRQHTIPVRSRRTRRFPFELMRVWI